MKFENPWQRTGIYTSIIYIFVCRTCYSHTKSKFLSLGIFLTEAIISHGDTIWCYNFLQLHTMDYFYFFVVIWYASFHIWYVTVWTIKRYLHGYFLNRLFFIYLGKRTCLLPISKGSLSRKKSFPCISNKREPKIKRKNYGSPRTNNVYMISPPLENLLSMYTNMWVQI